MDAETSWDEGAEAWTAFVRTGQDYYRTLVHGPALLTAGGDVAGLDALDLGCGEGYFARELARAGARVTGVDISGQLIRMAREHAPELAIDFVQAAAHEIAARFEPGRFDLVASCMALQDMEHIDDVLAAVHAVLRPNGRFVFSVPHPGTDTPHRAWERGSSGEKLALKIDRYFDTGPAVMDWSMPRLLYRWRTPHWRRTLSEWSRLVTTNGFGIQGLEEPCPSADALSREPRLEDCARVPYFLVWSTTRQGG